MAKLWHLGLALLLALVPACKTRCSCVPDEIAERNDLIDLCGAGDRPTAPPGQMRELMALTLRRAAGHHPADARPYHVLALSGGGLYGSFGVGVLNGWTASDTRPTFDVVTGISVGSIQSTYAFLGPKYDEALRQETVGVEREDILRQRPIASLLCATSVYDSARLKSRLERSLTPELLGEVAAAHAEGRRLYVGTCNLDARKLIIWDMGAIASQGTPESVRLYRDVVLASASIPGVMPPVKLPVEIDGQPYTELHVDGATADAVFFRGFMIADLNRARGNPSPLAPPGSRLTVINNGKLYSTPDCVRPKLLAIAANANEAVIYNKGRDELYRAYLNCLETAVEFRLTMIPQDLQLRATSALNVKADEQELLFATGYKIGQGAATNDGWRDTPPGSEANEQELPRSGLKFATPAR